MLSVLLNAPALTQGLPVGGRAVALGVSGAWEGGALREVGREINRSPKRSLIP